jgi:hypothetical protein
MLRSLPLAFTALLVFCAGALAQPLPLAKPESVDVASRQLAQIAGLSATDEMNLTTAPKGIPPWPWN